jgi:DNA-binding CsgD family transcriptional regulator
MRVYRFEASAALAEVEEALTILPTSERDLVHLASLAMTTTMSGREDARAQVLQAADSAWTSPHGHTYTLAIGWPLVWLEEYEAAGEFIRRSLAIQREGGHLAYLPQALLSHAELDFRTGDWESARHHAEESLRLFEEGDQPTEAAIASAMLAKLDAVVGDEASMLRRAVEAKNGDLGTGLRAATAYSLAAEGLLHLGRGDSSDAITYLNNALELARLGDIGEPWLLPHDADLAEAHIRSGDQALGEAIARQLVERGEQMGRDSAVAAGLRCLALAAPSDEFEVIFKQAVEIHRSLPTPFELARTELCWGERLRRNRQRLDARDHLRKALEGFERLGANPWIERAQSELASSGETRQQRSPNLTPQERQVANLVATGLTNREAAAKLFVSAKTIEFHLGSIYRKLGIRSRTQLANAWHYRGGKT